MSPPSQTDRFDDVTLAILAGGAGSRMGKPKGLLTIGNQPILDYLLDHLAWPGQTMLVTAPDRQRPPGHSRFTREVVDPISGAGPLRGVLTALENLGTPLLLVLTVDMPGIRLSQCEWIVDALRSDSAAHGMMMKRSVQGRLQVEPFPFVLTIDAKPIVARRFAEGRRSVHGLLEEDGFKTIEAPPTWHGQVWANLNTQTDLANFAS